MVKKGLINQLKTIGEMGIFNVITAILLSVAYTNSVYGDVSGGPIPVRGSMLNMYFYIPSMIILIVLYFIFCFKYLEKRFNSAYKTHWAFVILFIICIALFLIVELFIWALVGIFTTGLFSTFVNESDAFMYALIAIFVVLPIIMMVYSLLKNKKTNN